MIKRIRAARHYQRPDDQTRLLAEAGIPLIRRDAHEALTHLGDLIHERAAIYLIRAGLFRDVSKAVAFGHFREVLKALFDRIAKVRDAGAVLGTRRINRAFSRRGRAVRFAKKEAPGRRPGPRSREETPKEGGGNGREPDAAQLQKLFDADPFAKDIGDRFNFDRFDQATYDRIRAEQDRLIQQLDVDARSSIDSIVSAGVRSGLSPEDIVQDIRELIGLTANQAQAVMNYRSLLETLDPAALQRQLRDQSLDPTFQAALDAGVPLDEATIDQAVDQYRENYLAYRAGTIAQTESVRAASAGLRDSYSQAVDRGALPSAAVRRFWQLADRPCPICESIPDMNPDGVAVDEAFNSSGGLIDDTPVHPNCMCSVEYVTDLDKVPDDEEDA